MNYFSYLYFLTSIILENIVVCSNLLQTGKGGAETAIRYQNPSVMPWEITDIEICTTEKLSI